MTAALIAFNRRTFASLRRHRNYRLFFSGQVISVTGTWMQRVAQAWLVLQLTHSAIAVGILALAQFLPFTVFGLFAGVLVDRLDPRRTVIATQTSAMVLAAGLAALALSGTVEPWQVYVIGFLAGTVQVLDAPARQALTYRMVGPAELPNAVALNSSLFNGARIFGPGLGGLLVAAVGAGYCFLANAVSFLAVLGVLLAMRETELFNRPAFARPRFLAGIGEGFRYMRESRRALAVLLLVATVSCFAVNNNVLLPVLAEKTLHSGPGTFGLLSAFFGAGALVGGLATASLGRASVRLLLLGAAGFGAAQLLLAPARSLPVALVLLFAAGICFMLWSSNSNSLLQLEAPDHLRGRVIGLYFYGFAGTGSFGGLFAGWLAGTGGTTLAYAVAGCVSIAAAFGAFFGLGGRVRHPTERSGECTPPSAGTPIQSSQAG
jgi:MFS family permease